MKPLFALVLALSPSLAAAVPAMVTTAKGDVHLLEGGEDKAAPAPPFLLQETAKLELRDDAEVVLLYGGIANHLVGPRKVGLADLSTGSESAADRGALEDLLSKAVVTRRAAATRGGGTRVSRPVPGTSVSSPRVIRWECDGCGEVEVQVYDFMNDKVLWTTKGTGQVDYAGPALEPGAYSVVVGGSDFPFSVPEKGQLDDVVAAREAADKQVDKLRKAGLDNEAALAAVPATVYLQAGMPSEALYTIDAALAVHPDDPELKALLGEFEKRAGLRKE